MTVKHSTKADECAAFAAFIAGVDFEQLPERTRKTALGAGSGGCAHTNASSPWDSGPRGCAGRRVTAIEKRGEEKGGHRPEHPPPLQSIGTAMLMQNDLFEEAEATDAIEEVAGSTALPIAVP